MFQILVYNSVFLYIMKMGEFYLPPLKLGFTKTVLNSFSNLSTL
jgi:hypothetical protein